MMMMMWASRTPEHFLIHVRGAFHTIKEMELYSKFQETMKTVDYAILEVALAEMTYKDRIKKREKDDASQQAVSAGKAAPDRTKSSKRQRVTNPLMPRSLQ